jgi:hypothetical protein
MAGIIAAEASIDEIEASFNMVSKSCNKSKPILKAICELDMRVSYHQELWILPLLHLRDAVVIGAELPEALGMGRFSIAEVSRLRSTGYDLGRRAEKIPRWEGWFTELASAPQLTARVLILPMQGSNIYAITWVVFGMDEPIGPISMASLAVSFSILGTIAFSSL